MFFYIGGTKVGALCGEAVVFTKNNAPKHFLTQIKQHGALLAKARLLGIQFDTLFTDQLYMRISEHAIDMEEKLKMEPFVCEAEAVAGGKTVALFGSYGWGDGQWMRDWVDRMSGSGATVLNGEGLICQETPDEAALAECEALGKQLASI